MSSHRLSNFAFETLFGVNFILHKVSDVLRIEEHELDSGFFLFGPDGMASQNNSFENDLEQVGKQETADHRHGLLSILFSK